MEKHLEFAITKSANQYAQDLAEKVELVRQNALLTAKVKELEAKLNEKPKPHLVETA